MKYKVCNLERDMKLGTRLIKQGESISVSQQDYQYLAHVYGMAVKGEREYTVRTTMPVQIETPAKTHEQISVKKRRKKK